MEYNIRVLNKDGNSHVTNLKMNIGVSKAFFRINDLGEKVFTVISTCIEIIERTCLFLISS